MKIKMRPVDNASMEVPFFPEESLEAAANELLDGYARKNGPITAPPIPVEDILEFHLGLSLDFDSLKQDLGDDVLGATCAEDGRVYVDESLDPHRNQPKEGPFRFTIAHEIAHWQLHRHDYTESSGPISSRAAKLVYSRGTPTNTRIEAQANRFASYLLMPRSMVMASYKEIFGTLDPNEFYERQPWTFYWHSQKCVVPKEDEVEDRVTDMAYRYFKVSRSAMRIRLEGLGLIRPSSTHS